MHCSLTGERSNELSFIPNFLLLYFSLENTSAGHCIWGFVQDFAVGLPLQHPTASAPPLGMGCQETLSFHTKVQQHVGLSYVRLQRRQHMTNSPPAP